MEDLCRDVYAGHCRRVVASSTSPSATTKTKVASSSSSEGTKPNLIGELMEASKSTPVTILQHGESSHYYRAVIGPITGFDSVGDVYYIFPNGAYLQYWY